MPPASGMARPRRPVAGEGRKLPISGLSIRPPVRYTVYINHPWGSSKVMSQHAEFGRIGRYHLQNESYGIAAFFFHRALLYDTTDGNAWNGFILSIGLMRRENDMQTALARYALQEGVPYDKDLMTFAMMSFQQSPFALAAWIRALSDKSGIPEPEKETLVKIADEMDEVNRKLTEEHGEQKLRAQGMFRLEEYAARPMELDMVAKEPTETVYKQIESWLGDPQTALSGVRLLCMIPDLRSEKMLRRVCRNERMDGKTVTQALLALRWLGVRGNARLQKKGQAYIINLDNPQPELTITVPNVFRPALDRMKLWMAKQQGFVAVEAYEEFASTDDPALPPELAEQVEKADIPGPLQEVVHTLIRAAYDLNYPQVPTEIEGARKWSGAFLLLAKDYTEGIGEKWNYGEPEKDEMVIRHYNWLLTGTPDFYKTVHATRRLRAQLGI